MTESTKKRVRSPRFPFIDLDTAMRRAKTFYQSERRNNASISVAVRHWDYNDKSSGGLQTISALKEFGLMEDSASKKARMVKLTDRALRILLDEREGSSERDQLIREAALLPKIYTVLWEHYNQELPSDSNLRHYLTLDYKPPFNENSVDDFIKQFRATLSFAKLDGSDSISEEGEDTMKPPEDQEMPDASLRDRQKLPPPPPSSANAPYITFPLPRGNKIEIRLQSKVSATEFDQLKQVLELMKPSIVENEDS